MRKLRPFHIASGLVAAAVITNLLTGVAAAFEPKKPQCIAPADPGGGLDFACRTVGRLLPELNLVNGSVQTVNMPGGVGAVAYGHTVGDRAADPNSITTVSAVGATQIAQDKFPGGPDLVRWIAMVGADVGIIVVDSDSKIKSLKDLAESIKNDPSGLVAGGSSSIGGWDHIRYLLFARSVGLSGEDLKRLRWVQYESGGPAVTQMMGGHLDVVTVDISELTGFIQSGDVRVLAVLSESPLPQPWADLPTARQQGYDVVGYNWRGFYMGPEVSDEEYEGWVGIFEKLYNSPAWMKAASDAGLLPIWRGGVEFEDYVKASIAEIRKISQEIGVIR